MSKKSKDHDIFVNEFQIIPHRPSTSLNALLKTNYKASLDLDFDHVIQSINQTNLDFISNEDDKIQIKEAHNRFIEYLKLRLGSSMR